MSKDSAAAANMKAALSVERVGFVTQTVLLFDREIKKLIRDKLSMVIRIGSNVVFGLLFGVIFYQVGEASYVLYPEVMASFGGKSLFC